MTIRRLRIYSFVSACLALGCGFATAGPLPSGFPTSEPTPDPHFIDGVKMNVSGYTLMKFATYDPVIGLVTRFTITEDCTVHLAQGSTWNDADQAVEQTFDVMVDTKKLPFVIVSALGWPCHIISPHGRCLVFIPHGAPDNKGDLCLGKREIR